MKKTFAKTNDNMKRILSFFMCFNLLTLCVLGGCGKDEPQSDRPNDVESIVATNGDEEISGSSFISISKTDIGDLIIQITDDSIPSFQERIEALDSAADNIFTYELNKDGVFDITFYGSEGILDDYPGYDDWNSAIAILRVYPYGAEFLDYKRVFTESSETSSYGEEWTYNVNMYGPEFQIDGETLTLTFGGAGDLLNGTKAYVCRRHMEDDSWETAEACISVGDVSGVLLAELNDHNDFAEICFGDEDTVLISIFGTDREIFEHYVICFGNGVEDFEHRYSAPLSFSMGYYHIDQFGTQLPECYCMEGTEVINDPNRTDDYLLEGDAAVFDDHISIRYNYEGIKDIVSNYEYIGVYLVSGSEEELVGYRQMNQFIHDEKFLSNDIENIEPIRDEYVCKYDGDVFVPATKYYYILSSVCDLPISQTMEWRQIKTTYGTPMYPEPPFPYAWGCLPVLDLDNTCQCKATMLESFDEFGHLVQSVIRYEYDSTDAKNWSWIDARHIYYPYSYVGVDEPDMQYVVPEYYDECREEALQIHTAEGMKILKNEENTVYYDLMDLYVPYGMGTDIFEREFKILEIDDYYVSGETLTAVTHWLSNYLSAISAGDIVDLWVLNDSENVIRNFHESGVYPTQTIETGLSYLEMVGKIHTEGGYADFIGGGSATFTGYSNLNLLPLLH